MYPRGEGGGLVGVVVVVVIIAHTQFRLSFFFLFFLFELSREEEEEEKRRMLVKIEYTNSRRRDPLYTVKSFSRDRRPPNPHLTVYLLLYKFILPPYTFLPANFARAALFYPIRLPERLSPPPYILPPNEIKKGKKKKSPLLGL